MAGLQVCAPEPFVGTQQFQVPYGTTITQLSRVKASTWTLTVCRRPCIPIWGLHENAAPNNNTYDFAPSTKGNENVLVLLGKAALEASVNYVNGIQGLQVGMNTYVNNEGQDFGSYLSRKVSSNQCLVNRYLEVFNKARQFFNLHAAIGAFNFAIYQELTEILIPKVMREADKQMFIPPGIYFFDGTALAVALDAWFAADPSLKNLFSIELVTT